MPPATAPPTPTPKPFCSLTRALSTFLFYLFPCIYLDLVASNYAVVRWNLLPESQKPALPDITHDHFDFYENRFFKEGPLVVLYIIVIFGFILPYDILGFPLTHKTLSKPFTICLNTKKNRTLYRRGECTIRFFETRSILELMRASSVWVTSLPDPRGPECSDVETSQIDNIWTHNTFARCGDNIYSGHAGQVR